MAEGEKQRDVQPLNVLVDTNVAIDWLNDRKPWSDDARPLWEGREMGQVNLYLPASVLTDIFYILRKSLGNNAAKSAVMPCVAVCGLLPIDATVIERALSLPGADFEDNVQIACSLIYPIHVIVTRNPDDFAWTLGVTVPALNPRDIERYLPPASTS